MTKDFKSLLQICFQKKSLTLPIYKSERSGGPDHSPLWISNVIVYNGDKFSGNISSTKIEAEQSAAYSALKSLKLLNSDEIVNKDIKLPKDNGLTLGCDKNLTKSEKIFTFNDSILNNLTLHNNPQVNPISNNNTIRSNNRPLDSDYRLFNNFDDNVKYNNSNIESNNLFHHKTSNQDYRSNNDTFKSNNHIRSNNNVRSNSPRFKNNTVSDNVISKYSGNSIFNRSVYLKQSKGSIFKSNERIALIVDIENLHTFVDKLPDKINNVTIYVFVGEHHSLVNKKYNKNEIIIVSESTRPNGTDSCIQVYVGMLLTKNLYDYYLIATRDNFGSSLVDVITSKMFSSLGEVVTDPSTLIFS